MMLLSIKRSYNPFRTTSDTTYGYAENTYDALGRVTAVATSDGSSVGTSYSGNTVTVTDQASKQRKSVTDALGRLKTVYEPDSGGTLNVNTDYTYDVLNNLLTVSQGSQTRTFSYDNLSRLTQAVNPESGTVSYGYDPNGNLTSKVDPRTTSGSNWTTSYAYDDLNRITSRTYSNDGGVTAPVYFYYDSQSLPSGAPSYTRGSSIGRLVAVTYGSSSSNGTYRAYDKLGRVTEQWQRTDTTNYEIDAAYDLANGMTSQTYPGDGTARRSVSYSFDAAGRMSSLSTSAVTYNVGSFAAASVSSVSYAAQGGIASQTLGNGLVHAIGYNTRLQPTSIQLGSSGATMSLSYTYGTSSTNNGNITSIAYSGGGTSFTQDFTYDNLNRLATAQEQSGSSWTQTNGYDRYGNRTITAGVGSGTAPTFSSTTNRITTSGYSYDAAGNLTVDPSHAYTYDAENKILKLDTVLAYAYDGEGKRVRKYVGENTRFVYGIGGELLAEYNGSTNAITKEYLYGASGLTAVIDPTNGTEYLTPDHLGSPRVVTNSSATVTQRRDFMPFGEEVTSGAGRSSGSGWSSVSAPRQKFTGYERDSESGLDFAQARDFGSSVGRFSSRSLQYSCRLVKP
ncbi:MAG: RHS repeat protein [Acidobacteria bacterium]|nr:RHS repeat protein [Acidobacteriota bacterium]